ncbi:MAG: potassium transporter Kup [Verrucomicrobiota bacterium]
MSHSTASPVRAKFGLLCLTTLGIVFGDIGTSPLYAMRECFEGNPHHINPESILGVLSLIIWTIIIMISVQYVGLVMKADKQGEGGILSLLSVAFPDRKGMWRTPTARIMLALAVFGAALLYGDAMITPAISVISAVEGLTVVAPHLDPNVIVLITLGILAVMFSLQQLGTAKVGAAFGPIMLVWFFTLAVLGVVWIVQAPEVLKAFNPWLGARFLLTHGHESVVVLTGVFLTITGGEALYGDMGHVGRRSITMSWFTVVKPALIINYLGQGALLLTNAEGIQNPLQFMTPVWGRMPLLILATCAAVIASQALISGVFSLTMQAVQLGYLPRIRISHTSSSERGQIYISKVNWLLMAGCMGLVISFKSSKNLAAAYGIAVSMTMAVTSILLFFAATRAWKWTPLKAGAAIIVQVTLNLVFVYANSLKVLHGGFVPIIIAVLLYTMMVTWKTGRRHLGTKLSEQALPLKQFLESIERGKSVHRVPGTAVFMAGATGLTPISLLHNLKHNKVLHERILFLTIDSELHPYVDPDRRLTVEKLGENIYRIVGHFGFMEQPDVTELLRQCAGHDLILDPMQTSYFLGRETIIPTRHTFAYWRSKLFSVMSRNAQSAVAYYNIPPSRVVEFGIQIEL